MRLKWSLLVPANTMPSTVITRSAPRRIMLGLGMLTAVVLSAGAGPALKLGANVNEHLTYLTDERLKLSRTDLVRGFIPATPFIQGKRKVATDSGLQRLKTLGESGYQVLLTIKWNFRSAKWSVPRPGSPREESCLAFVEAVLAEMDGRLAALAVVNEVFIDTRPEDMEPTADGVIPMVRFMQRVVDHVSKLQPKNAANQPLPLYAGGFTRLYNRPMQQRPATRALLDWIRTDERVTGPSYHIHADNLDQFDRSMKFVRDRIPGKPSIITEFSLVWKFKQHLPHRIDASARGRSFLKRYGLPADMTVRAFINAAVRSPISEQQYNDFLNSQDWYVRGFLNRVLVKMQASGVAMATYAFSQGSSGPPRELKPDSTPWILNPIFLPVMAKPPQPGKPAVNRELFKNYVTWQSRTARR